MLHWQHNMSSLPSIVVLTVKTRVDMVFQPGETGRTVRAFEFGIWMISGFWFLVWFGAVLNIHRLLDPSLWALGGFWGFGFVGRWGEARERE